MLRPKKIWYQAECWVTQTKLLVAQSAFLENGAIGIHIDDGVNPVGPNKYPDDQILIRAYFDHNNEADLTHKFALFFDDCRLEPPTVSFSLIEEQDWQGNFVRSYKSFLVEPDIYIVPSFDEEFKKNLPPLFLEIDPENAFGTGLHQTTKLCLTALRTILPTIEPNSRALDVGCGSGILSILMKKLGLSSVMATDTDEDSIICTKKNAEQNGVHVETLLVDPEHAYESGHYDVVVANILAVVLIDMAKNLAQTVKPNGFLILSGILLSQKNDVIDAYQKLGLNVVKETSMDDWCAIVLTRF